MEYKLKRPTKKLMAIYGGFVVLGLIGIFSGDGFISIIFTLLSSCFLINEFIRCKDKEFTFDENGFFVGEIRYSYADIQRIKCYRYRHLSGVRIIVDGNTVYKFDTSYEGAKSFVKFLTLNGIDHDLFR